MHSQESAKYGPAVVEGRQLGMLSSEKHGGVLLTFSDHCQ